MTAPGAEQTVAHLVERFAIPGSLSFREKDGLIFAGITSASASGTICLQGAHLLHWVPRGQQPVLFLSQKSEMAPGKAIRGGVPLLFPWFGPRHDGKNGPAHGFARVQPWSLEFAAIVGEDVHLTLTLGPTELSRSLGFDHFRLALQITLGKSLKLQFTVANEGPTTLAYEEGMHTYFAVQDVHQIVIEGLDGTSFIDKKDDFKVKPQTAGPMQITSPTDRVYLETTATCMVRDRALNRVITVEKTNSHNTVVWNPWGDMPDIQPDGWHESICVEAVNVGQQSVTLSPGDTHTMQANISVASA